MQSYGLKNKRINGLTKAPSDEVFPFQRNVSKTKAPSDEGAVAKGD